MSFTFSVAVLLERYATAPSAACVKLIRLIFSTSHCYSVAFSSTRYGIARYIVTG
jgi:hypothetical protein